MKKCLHTMIIFLLSFSVSGNEIWTEESSIKESVNGALDRLSFKPLDLFRSQIQVVFYEVEQEFDCHLIDTKEALEFDLQDPIDWLGSRRQYQKLEIHPVFSMDCEGKKEKLDRVLFSGIARYLNFINEDLILENRRVLCDRYVQNNSHEERELCPRSVSQGAYAARPQLQQILKYVEGMDKNPRHELVKDQAQAAFLKELTEIDSLAKKFEYIFSKAMTIQNFSCLSPSLTLFLNQNLDLELKESCESNPNQLYMDKKDQHIDVSSSHIESVEMTYVTPGDDFISMFGHAMMKFTLCEDETCEKVKPYYLSFWEFQEQGITRISIRNYHLQSWRYLRDILNEESNIVIRESRPIYNLKFDLEEKDRKMMLTLLAEVSESFRGKWSMLFSNCIQNLIGIFKAFSPEPELHMLDFAHLGESFTPRQFYRTLGRIYGGEETYIGSMDDI